MADGFVLDLTPASAADLPASFRLLGFTPTHPFYAVLVDDKCLVSVRLPPYAAAHIGVGQYEEATFAARRVAWARGHAFGRGGAGDDAGASWRNWTDYWRGGAAPPSPARLRPARLQPLGARRPPPPQPLHRLRTPAGLRHQNHFHGPVDRPPRHHLAGVLRPSVWRLPRLRGRISTADVSVAVASSATSTATARPGTLTFTAQDWNVPQPIDLSGVDDANTTDDDATVTHTPTGADYNSVALPSQGVRVATWPA